MILCLDVGNTSIHGGVYENDELVIQFRKTSRNQFSSDEYGIFFRNVLKENDIDYKSISEIAICSVVPDVLHSLSSAAIKYFGIEPFVLKAGVKTGLNIKYRNPREVGTDRIANAIAAIDRYGEKNMIVVDFGTATTFCVISENKEYLGGIILPGIRISMEALVQKTAKLPVVEIKQPDEMVGKTTVESIQAGLYYSQVAIVKEFKNRIKNEVFNGEDPVVIGTGGFARLFTDENIFDLIIPTLALDGLYLALKMNRSN